MKSAIKKKEKMFRESPVQALHPARILEEEVRFEVRGEIVEVVLPAKQQTILTLMLLYGEEALKKRPHETAEALRVDSFHRALWPMRSETMARW